MRTCLTLLFALLINVSFAQEGTVKGVVLEKSTKASLIGATVISGDYGTITNLEGEFELRLPVGPHTLKISYVGYQQQLVPVEIVANEVVEVTITLTDDVNSLDMVVVSAGRFEQKIEELTLSMEVIKPDLIENKNTTSIDDALQQTPGLVIVDNEPQIRSGSGYSFGAGSRVMILVDDLPLLSGDAGRPSWGFLPVENVEQIEVIKGASSVLYGSAALSGVINLRTAYPGGEPKTKANLFYGVYSDPKTTEGKYWNGTPMMTGMNFFHSRRIGNMSMVVGGSFLADDGHLGPVHDENGEPAPSGFTPFDVNRYAAETRGRMNMNLRWQPEKIQGLAFGVNTNWLQGESLNTLLWGGADSLLYSAFGGSATRTKQVVGNVDPYVQYLTKNGAQHSLRTRWFNLDNDNDNNQGNFSDVYYGEYQYQQHYDSIGIKDFTSTIGLMGIYTDATGELYTGGNPNGENQANNYAAYIQLDKKFLDRITVSAGYRIEHFQINDEEETKPVFRSGLNIQALPATFIRASYGEGFRFPTIAERYIQTAVGELIIFPNPDLSSESSFNAEIGIKQGFKIGEFQGFADVAYFHQEYDNYIEFTFGQWNDTASFDNFLGLGFKSVNTGGAKVTGVDFSLLGQGKIGRVDVQFLGGYTYSNPVSTTPNEVYATSGVDTTLSPQLAVQLVQFGETTYANTSSDTTGYILKYRMQHLIRADIQATYNAWTLGLSYRYNSSMRNIDGIFEELDSEEFPHIPLGIIDWQANHTAGDHIFDARLLYQLNETHRLAIIVNNIANREYAIRPLTIEKPRTTVIQYTISI